MTKRHKAKGGRTADGGSKARHVRAGLVLLADVDGFSLLSEQKQRYVMERLFAFVERHKLVSRSKERVLNGTGDGVLVAFPCKRFTPDYGELVRFAEEMIAHLEQGEPSVGLRIGLHEGTFFSMSGLEAEQVVGSGPNQAARVASIGDGGYIIASESFVSAWANLLGKEEVEEKFSKPIEVFVKHDIPMRVRVFGPSTLKPPRKVAFLDAVHQTMRRTLQHVEEVLLAGLRLFDPELSRRKVSVRVSVLALGPTNKERVLVATDYRYHHNDEKTHKGTTRYHLDDVGEGPPGRAYNSGNVFVVAGLPDFRTSPDKYVSRLVNETGMDGQTIREVWQRRARAFMAIPFSLVRGDADGVLCVDLMDPLRKIALKDLNDIAEWIRDEYASHVAALWALRVQK